MFSRLMVVITAHETQFARWTIKSGLFADLRAGSKGTVGKALIVKL